MILSICGDKVSKSYFCLLCRDLGPRVTDARNHETNAPSKLLMYMLYFYFIAVNRKSLMLICQTAGPALPL